MHDPETPKSSLRDNAELWFLRFAAGGWVPARWFMNSLPSVAQRAARRGILDLEIVSHCWRYSHLLAYQLSSLVLYPPSRLKVTMTVFHATEDEETVALLRFFSTWNFPNVTWNWQVMDAQHLFRRAIGRNRAARATTSDWIWFTDCDVAFHRGCLDGLADALQGRRDALVFPREERCSHLLPSSDPMLNPDQSELRLVDIDPSRFSIIQQRDRATGPLQIVHGDVARACGYCESLRVYQQPSRKWTKATEDRAFRWLLGTPGVPIDVPGVYRIRHMHKGRYQGSRVANLLRTRIRKTQSSYRDSDRHIATSRSQD